MTDYQNLGYEFACLMDLLKSNAGVFTMNEKGYWNASILGKYQYQGNLMEAYQFRNAYCYLFNKAINQHIPEDKNILKAFDEEEMDD